MALSHSALSRWFFWAKLLYSFIVNYTEKETTDLPANTHLTFGFFMMTNVRPITHAINLMRAPKRGRPL